MVQRPQPPEPLKPIPVYVRPVEPTPVAAPPASTVPTQAPAILALVLGALAFLNGWAPIVGIVIGIPAVIVGGLAVLKKLQKGYAVTGIVLGAVGALSSVLATYFLYN